MIPELSRHRLKGFDGFVKSVGADANVAKAESRVQANELGYRAIKGSSDWKVLERM